VLPLLVHYIPKDMIIAATTIAPTIRRKRLHPLIPWTPGLCDGMFCISSGKAFIGTSFRTRSTHKHFGHDTKLSPYILEHRGHTITERVVFCLDVVEIECFVLEPSKCSRQYLHLIASSCISSAQKGHFFISTAPVYTSVQPCITPVSTLSYRPNSLPPVDIR